VGRERGFRCGVEWELSVGTERGGDLDGGWWALDVRMPGTGVCDGLVRKLRLGGSSVGNATRSGRVRYWRLGRVKDGGRYRA
jgi:hypothetical protein